MYYTKLKHKTIFFFASAGNNFKARKTSLFIISQINHVHAKTKSLNGVFTSTMEKYNQREKQ
jgi:hypothetical protein